MCVLLAVSAIAYSRPTTQETKQQKSAATSQPGPETTPKHEPQPAASAANTGAPDTKDPANAATENAASAISKRDLSKGEVADEPSQPYMATAYSLRGVTASGRPASKGLIAADPSVLPLGTRVRVEAGPLSGEYLVADTGGGVKGHRIDIWTPTTSEAIRFGNRAVKLTVLSYGPRKVTSATKRKSTSQTHGTRSENSNPPATKTPF
jgi:3D (Asp-Asp-Asp) domain-containing protein